MNKISDAARLLLGNWRGNGTASFPTIPTFAYREELEFTANDVQPILRYEQRTWKRLETGEYTPSHWEVGFWRVLATEEIEVLCAQSGGRVEILRGHLEPVSGGFSTSLYSLLLANDPRMDKTSRQFVLNGDQLEYTMQMGTTAVPTMTLHLRATLMRQAA